MKLKLKIKALLLTAGVLLCIGAAYLAVPKVIGSISGPEWEIITIGSKTYRLNHQNDFSEADRGRFLGLVKSSGAAGGSIAFRVYAVKGDKEGQWLYRLWEWEGSFYQLAE